MAKGIEAFPFGAISAYFQGLCHVSFKECTLKNILSLKRKLTMETRPFEDVFSIENGDVQYHVSFRGCTFPETNSEFTTENWYLEDKVSLLGPGLQGLYLRSGGYIGGMLRLSPSNLNID